MNTKKLFLLLFVSVAALAFKVIDDEPLRKFFDKFQVYLKERPTEKVYIHADKAYYAAGDTLWMKAYLVDGIVHQADSISMPLYIRLTDADGKLIEKKIIRLENGYGYGNFAISDSIPEGSYQLTAFTNWMRNQPEDFFFRKTFNIYRPNLPKKEIIETASVIDVQFFPEGGYWVQGIRSKIAFKAIDQNGKSIAVEGAIYEQNTNEALMPFKSEFGGMGNFYMVPRAGKKYVAKVDFKGKLVTFNLPETRPEGVIMTVGNLMQDNIKIQLAHNFAKEKIETEPYYIVAHVRGIVRFINQLPTTMDKTFYIQRSKIPEAGVITFTLFDKNFNPIAERLAYNNQEAQNLKVKLTTDKAEYGPRELVKMDVSITDGADKPVSGSFSMAVTSANQILDKKLFQDNILTSLLLTSDLKGTIEQPAYYFDKTNENAPQHLDNLMLTQGWRRFAWQELNSPLATANNFERGLNIKGRLYGAKKLTNKTNLSLILEANGANAFLNSTSNTEGEFLVQNVDFEGTGKMGLKGIDGKAPGAARLMLQGLSVVTPTITKVTNAPYYLTRDELNNFLTKSATRISISGVMVKPNEQSENKQSEPTKNKKEKTGDIRRAIYGSPDFSLDVNETMANGMTSVQDLIRGRLPGVIVGASGEIIIRGVGSLNGSNEPLKLVDGIPAEWTGLNVNDIETVDLIKGSNASAFGSRGANGVLNLLTKRTKMVNASEEEEGKNGFIKGFATVREFYSPKYNTDKRANALPDLRSTIYWNPNIKTDASGKTTLSFYNSDEKTIMRANLQGMNPKGGIGIATVDYLVK
jgi:hypothetical protein